MLQESSSRTRSLENRKSVTKLLTETTADPVKEDDQASDFGDFEEDDPRPKKRLVFNENIFFSWIRTGKSLLQIVSYI